MPKGDEISFYATILSLFGVVIAIFAYLQSRKSLHIVEHSEFEKLKSDVLNDISRILALLERRRIDFNVLKSTIEAHPGTVKEVFIDITPVKLMQF